MNLYESIAKLADEKGYSIGGLSKAAKISTAILSDLKRGRTKDLSRRTVAKLADVLGVTVEEIYSSGKSAIPVTAVVPVYGSISAGEPAFAERLDEFQARMGLKNTAELARCAGIPSSTLSEVRNGAHSLSVKNAEKLAAFVGVSIDEIYGKEKAPDTEASEAERNLLRLFMSMTDEQQQLVLRIAETIAEQRPKGV